MADSFAQGLASGAEAGVGLALRKNQQQFEQGLQEQQESRAEQDESIKQTAAQRAALQDQLSAVQAQKATLGNTIGTRLSANPQGLPADEMDNYKQQKKALEDQEQSLLVRQGGAKLTQWAGNAEKTGQDLASGNTDITNLSPKDAYDFVTHHSGQPAENYVDTPNRPSPAGQNFQKIHQGIQNMQQDNGAMLLQGLNAQYGHNLHGLIGKTAGDGVSTVVGAEFAAPVPHPGSPAHFIPTIKLSVKGPHGEVVDQYVPVMDDHGQILAHPDDSADATVKHMGLDDVFNHIGADETFYKAINSSPEMQSKILQAVNQGHDADAKEMQALALQLGGDPTKWQVPKETVIGADGQPIYTGAPGEKVVNQPQTLAAAQTRADSATAIALARIAAGIGQPHVSPEDERLNTINKYAADHDMTVDDAAKKLEDLGVIKGTAAGGTGGRQAVYNERIINAGQQAIADLDNILKLPVAASTGLLGSGIGAAKSTSILDIGKTALQRELTPQDSQQYATLSAGLGRYASTLEGSGLPGTAGMTNSATAQLTSAPGETYMTRLTKIAQTRQIVENGLEAAKAAPGLTPDQVKMIDDNLAKLRKVVPFTPSDVIRMTGSKGKTMREYSQQQGLDPALDHTAPPSPSQPGAPSPTGWSITPVQ
jgi:hypothetical protein